MLLGSVVWILDAAWGWSAGGWLTLRFGFHDSIASGVVHGVAGAFTLGVLFNLGPRIGRYTRDGLARTFKPHNLHITALGLMLIFTGFYAFYGACLVIASTSFPGWANIYLSPTTLGSITMVITMGFAGGFTGGYFASRGDPFWTISGGLAGVIGVSAGADVYAPTLAYLLSMLTAALAYYASVWIEHRQRVDDAVGAVAVHGVSGFLGMLWVGVFAAGYPTGLNNVESSIGGQLMGMATFLPLGFLSGYCASWVLKRLNLLRVPARGRDRGPRHGRVRDRLLPRARPRGRADHGARRHRWSSPSASCAGARGGEEIAVASFVVSVVFMIVVVGDALRVDAAPAATRRERSAMPAIIDSAPDCVTSVAGAKPADDSADFILQAAYEKCAGS